MPKLINLIGTKHGKLTVIDRVENYEGEAGDSRPQYLCECECGFTVVKVGRDLTRGSRNQACHHCSVRYGNNKGKVFERNLNGFKVR